MLQSGSDSKVLKPHCSGISFPPSLPFLPATLLFHHRVWDFNQRWVNGNMCVSMQVDRVTWTKVQMHLITRPWNTSTRQHQQDFPHQETDDFLCSALQTLSLTARSPVQHNKSIAKHNTHKSRTQHGKIGNCVSKLSFISEHVGSFLCDALLILLDTDAVAWVMSALLQSCEEP